MYLTIKQQIKLTKKEYLILKELCHISKNLYNQTLYEVRQKFFSDKKYLNYYEAVRILKGTENYTSLQAQVSQQTMKIVDENFKSFFALMRKNIKARIPKYLDKDGFFKLCIPTVNIKSGKFQLPYSRSYAKGHDKLYFNVPSILENKKVKQIWIIPRQNARYFEIQYVYEATEIKRELDNTTALAIDFGINNLCTCVTTKGNSFIIDGRKLKSFNQWYNKRNSILCSIKDKQKFGKKYTKQQYKILIKRNNRINDYIHKASRIIINYCISNNIGNLVCGMNKDFQRNSNIGKKNNQTFTQIPFGKIKNNLEYLSKLNGINFIEQEESYTSKASFWDKDKIPTYDTDNPQKYTFSGKRICRGMYVSKEGKYINADVNGALNILRKSKVVSLNTLYNRGELDTPVRIRVA